jgi:hypothetical protein
MPTFPPAVAKKAEPREEMAVVEAYVVERVPEVELKVRADESVSSPAVVANGTLPDVRFDMVRLESVDAPRLAIPAERLVAKRLVEEAVMANKLVVVALVEVEFRAVKLWRVVEARARSCWKDEAVKVEVAVKYPAMA